MASCENDRDARASFSLCAHPFNLKRVPEFYKILITKPVADKLNLQIDLPIVFNTELNRELIHKAYIELHQKLRYHLIQVKSLKGL